MLLPLKDWLHLDAGVKGSKLFGILFLVGTASAHDSTASFDGCQIDESLEFFTYGILLHVVLGHFPMCYQRETPKDRM